MGPGRTSRAWYFHSPVVYDHILNLCLQKTRRSPNDARSGDTSEWTWLWCPQAVQTRYTFVKPYHMLNQDI